MDELIGNLIPLIIFFAFIFSAIKKQAEKMKTQQKDKEEVIVYQAPIPDKFKKKIEKQINIQLPTNLEDLLFGKIKKPEKASEQFDEVKRKQVVLEKAFIEKSDLDAKKEIKKEVPTKAVDKVETNKLEDLIKNKDDLKKMIIFSEVIGLPISLRENSNKIYDIL